MTTANTYQSGASANGIYRQTSSLPNAVPATASIPSSSISVISNHTVIVEHVRLSSSKIVAVKIIK